MSDNKLTDEQVREVLERIDPGLDDHFVFNLELLLHDKGSLLLDKTVRLLAETTVRAERAEEENKLMKGAVGIIKDCVPKMKGGPNDQ